MLYNKKPYKFSGNSDKNIKEWLYQLKCILKLDSEVTLNDIHIYASMDLTGAAFSWHDDLTDKLQNWKEFQMPLSERYSKETKDIPTFMMNFLSKKQRENENTLEYSKEMQKLGEKAKMNQTLMVSTIFGNIDKTNQKLYRIHLKDNKTFKNLYEIIQLVEPDYETETAHKIKIYEDDNNKNYQNESNIVNRKIDKLALIIEDSKSKKNLEYKRYKIYC